jgi:hypothetical protein
LNRALLSRWGRGSGDKHRRNSSVNDAVYNDLSPEVDSKPYSPMSDSSNFGRRRNLVKVEDAARDNAIHDDIAVYVYGDTLPFNTQRHLPTTELTQSSIGDGNSCVNIATNDGVQTEPPVYQNLTGAEAHDWLISGSGDTGSCHGPPANSPPLGEASSIGQAFDQHPHVERSLDGKRVEIPKISPNIILILSSFHRIVVARFRVTWA